MTRVILLDMKTHTKSVFLIFLLVLVGCGPEIKVWTEKHPDSDQVKEWGDFLSNYPF